ncbi:MAG: LysR family substrate-binding domain-containing protein, partial [Nitratireductor sp.]
CAAAAHRGDYGELRIGILASLTRGFLHKLLRFFRERHPEVRLVLREGTPLESLHSLALGDLDISFVTGYPDLPGYTAQVLWNESVFTVLPRAHELAQKKTIKWDDIRREVFIVSRGGPGSEIQDYLIKKLSRPGFRPRIDVHDVSRGSLHDLVAMDYGITLASTSSVRADGGDVVFRLIEGEIDVLPSSAIWSPNNTNPALRHLLKLTADIACENSNEKRRTVA